jgi:hypothetical protein
MFSSNNPRRSRESGQAMLLCLLVLGLFLLGALGFAVDMSNLWFHRQSAQNAADAACTAGVMDMLSIANGGTPAAGFTPGTAYQCSSAPNSAPCKYTALNGYTPAALTAGSPGNDTSISFPSTVAGVPACTGTPTPAVCIAPTAVSAHPYIQANVTDRAQTFFSGLIRGSSTMDVGAQATCGLVLSNAPIPILILNPTVSGSLSGNGAIDIKLVGGPQRSIQVNSSSSTAVDLSGASGNIDLRQGGPSSTGSDFAVVGPEAAIGNFITGASGSWIDPSSAISDPFALLPAPLQPAAATPDYGVTGPAATAFGCPDSVGGCDHYFPGYYPSGIQVKKNQPAAASGYAVFDPGIYYLGGDFAANSSSCLRPSNSTGGIGGTMFYFSGTATLNIGANSGTLTNCQSTFVPLSQVKCTASSILPTNLPSAGLKGNVLLAPCSGTYGDPLGASDPLGEQRGMLFFQDRASSGVNPGWSGGGSFGLAGIMYFHNAASFNDTFSLGGGSSSDTFVVGEIVVDKLNLGGNPSITMDLNPNALYYTLKATLIQ